MSRFLVLLVLCVVYINCAVLKGKAFYCRDPDTGKLHEVNTTWAASSFCGNYTCNIRKRNGTTSKPIREFNITGINIDDHPPITENIDNITVTIEKKIEPDLLTILHTVTPAPRQVMDKSVSKIFNIIPSDDYFEQENNKPKENNCKMEKKVQQKDENDRYLTDKEIESIAEMLHTVRRSDLDAIVDIYNLAQDIYKEMDETTTENTRNDAMDIAKEIADNRAYNVLKQVNIQKHRDVKEPSYWYDPLAHKGRIAERYGANLQQTHHTTTTERPQSMPSSYDGRLLNEIEITPLYYPVTQFQRISSYTHPTQISYKATTQYIDNNRQFDDIRDDVQSKKINEKDKGDSQKLIRPSLYLPYPFTNIHPYNVTENRNIYYGSPWLLDYYNKYRYYQPYYNAYIGPVQKAVLINPHLNSEVQDIEQHAAEQPLEIKKEKLLNEDLIDTLLKGHITPSWKTDPVPLEVLKDIRADIDTTRLLKAFPLRKKIKLEKVGKLVNVADVNGVMKNRNKRFSADVEQKENVTDNVIDNNVEEYETYLEKVTCQDQMKLGYFRIGNLTQPYPGCCPQLIDTR